MKKSLFFNKPQSWIKKESGLFHVTMGAYDDAEVSELVEIFILYQLSHKYNKNNIGLNRDDGLAVFRNTSGHKQKKLRNIFKTYSVKII